MNGLLEVLGKLGPQRLAAMGAVTIALVGFFAYVILRVSQPTMTTLFTDLPVNDITAITRELDQRGVKYEMRQDGATIMVPQEQSLRLRLDLAGKGLPTGGGIGYEIFDKGDAFSTTSFVQNVNHVRALEGELARTIRAIDRVQQARVHLVLPERQLFSREKMEARASIVLKTRGDLDAGQIRAIRHLTATAVPNLKPESVSIVDESGRLLADGAKGDDAAAGDEKQSTYERRVRKQVEEIVASIVGQGRARVQVSAEMDFNRIQQTTENFDPESRVVRSTQSRTENALTSESKDGQVSVGNELPGANAPAADKAGSKDASNKNEEIVNYEISRTTRNEVIEAGRVKRLSVAVLVDGLYAKGAIGQDAAYQPRAQEDLDRIGALVRSSVGFDAKRGDQIEVVNLRFAEAPAVFEGKEQTMVERLLNFSKDDVLRMAELAILAVISLFVILLVVRPLMKQMGAPESAARAAPGALAIAGPGEPEQIEKAHLVDKVGDVVGKSPPEAVSILRQYIQGTA